MSMEEARIVSLKEAFDLDNTIGLLCDVPIGYFAERKSKKENWSVSKR